MIPTDSILIRLPYPVKFFTFPRKIGFLFTNLSIFLFREKNEIKTSKDYEAWVENNGQSVFLSEMLYCSACAYCLTNKTKQNFTKEGLVKAIALANQAKQEDILKVWRSSETFGATVKQSKKKVNPK